MNKNNIQLSLCKYLFQYHKGKGNAASSKQLEAVFHIKGSELRKAVNFLRCNGSPICSDINGYYYAENQDEIKSTIDQLSSRIVKISKAKNGLIDFGIDIE